MNQFSSLKRTTADLTGYKRDLLLAVYRANQQHDTPVGADVMDELEALGQTNTEGGQFYPRLNELVDQGFLAKTDHPNDARGFTCSLTDDGRKVLTQLFVRTARSLDIDAEVAEFDLPAEPLRPRQRQRERRLPGRTRR